MTIDAPPLVEPIILPIEPPKRGRGRPPKLDADGNRINTPRSATGGRRPRRASTTPRKPRSPRSLRPEIAAFLTLGNQLLLMSPLGTRPIAAVVDANIVPTRIGDELDAAEISALASAIDAQCTRSPRFRKYVEQALTVGAGGQLATILGMILTRRAARHGLAPAALDPMLGVILAGEGMEALGNLAPTPETPSEPDAETGEVAPRIEPIESPSGFDFERA